MTAMRVCAVCGCCVHRRPKMRNAENKRRAEMIRRRRIDRKIIWWKQKHTIKDCFFFVVVVVLFFRVRACDVRVCVSVEQSSLYRATDIKYDGMKCDDGWLWRRTRAKMPPYMFSVQCSRHTVYDGMWCASFIRSIDVCSKEREHDGYSRASARSLARSSTTSIAKRERERFFWLFLFSPFIFEIAIVALFFIEIPLDSRCVAMLVASHTHIHALCVPRDGTILFSKINC